MQFPFSHEERWSEDQGGDREKRQAEWDFSKDSFFCDVPGKVKLSNLSQNSSYVLYGRKYNSLCTGDRYPRIVFASAEGKNLWNIHALKSMCSFDSSRVCSIVKAINYV